MISTSKLINVTTPSPGIALVTLNRGPVNAFHEPFWTELGVTFRDLGKDGDVRVIVLASALPKYFTAGLDLTAAMSTLKPSSAAIDPARRARELREHIVQFQNAISAIEEVPQPVIGAAHGYALGLAIDILCACDIRYAATSSIFSIKEVDVGLAADIGTLARIPKITGNQSAIRELALTTRNFGAEEALQWGFVSKVVNGGQDGVIKAALETAAIIATKSPIAVVGTKHLLLHARDHSVRENLDYTSIWNSANLQTEDMADAIATFKTKAPPKFKSLPKL